MLFTHRQNPSHRLYNTIIDRNFRRVLRAIGLDILDANFSSKILTIIYVNIFIALLLVIYTVHVLRDHIDEVLQCICVLAIPLRSSISIRMLVQQRGRLLVMHKTMLWLHTHSRDAWQDVLHRWTQHAYFVFRVQSTLYVTTGVALVLYPFGMYLTNGKFEQMLTIRMPGINVKSKVGYVVATLYSVLNAYISVASLLAIDTLFVVLCLTACAYVEMVRVKCGRLGEHVAIWKSNKKTLDDGALTRELVATIVAGKRADAFVLAVCQCFESVCGMKLALNGFSLALCVLTGRLTGWLIAYPLGTALLYTMLVYALMGSLLEHQSDMLLGAIYEMPWHEMKVRERRMLALMLLHWQRTRGVQVFGSVKLNVATVMQILKTIYSGYMMLDSTL